MTDVNSEILKAANDHCSSITDYTLNHFKKVFHEIAPNLLKCFYHALLHKAFICCITMSYLSCVQCIPP